MKQLRQILALLLALGMILSLMPAGALAAGGSGRAGVEGEARADTAPAEAEPEPDEPESDEAARGGGGGGMLWNCSFRSFNDLLGWVWLDANGDGITFGPYFDDDETLYVRSDRNGYDSQTTVYSSDDYLITPRIELPSTGLEYTLGIQGAGILNGGYNADCEIYVYTGETQLRPDNLYSLLGHPYRFDFFFWDEWMMHYMDLSAYAGQTVQLVFRHKNSDSSVLKIKQVLVSWQEPDELLSKVTALNVPMPQLGVNVDELQESDIVFPDYANYELVPGSLRYFRAVGEDGVEMHDEVFTEGEEYSLRFEVCAKSGIETYSDGYASVNGKWAQYSYRQDTETVQIDYFNLPALSRSKEIREVSLRVDPPEVGTEPADGAERWLENGSTEFHYSVTGVSWDPAAVSGFESGTAYRVTVAIAPENGYYTTGYTHFTINGEPAEHYSLDGTQYVALVFEADQVEPLRWASLQLIPPRDSAPLTYAWTYNNPDYSIVQSQWFPLNSYGEVMDPLSEDDTYEGGRTYRYLFGLRPGDTQPSCLTEVTVNGTKATFLRRTGDVWYYFLDLKAKEKSTLTITFNAHGHGTAPDPVEIPYGSSLWDSVYYLNDLVMDNVDGMVFWGWSEHATDRRDDRISWENEFFDDTTLYAVWQEEIDGLALRVDQPIVLDPVDKPNTSISSEYNFAPEPLGWWDSANGYWEGANPLSGETFRAGKTYYGVVRLEPGVDEIFAEGGDVVSVLGARKVREDRVEATELNPNDGAVIYVTFSITVPNRTTFVDQIDLFVDIGWKGWLMNGTPPKQFSLTAGIALAEGSWWENLEDVGDESKAITGRFPTDCLIYADAQLWPSMYCSIAEDPTVTIDGGTLIRTEPGNGSLHVIYSVFSPAYHCVEFGSRGSGWFFMDDNPHARRWYEAPFYEIGTHTVTALPDPGWYFTGWYEGPDADTLVSTDRVYVYENEPGDEDLWLTAVFADSLTPVDWVEIEVPIPAAGDSFNWETDSAGAVVTNGAAVTITRDIWYNEWGLSGNPLPFEEGENYFVGIDLTAKPGYEITDNTIFLINGEEVVWKQQSNVTTWSIASRNYTMTAPTLIDLVEIQVPIPAAGDSFYYDTDSAGAYVVNGDGVEIIADKWCTDGGIGGNPLPFEEGNLYRLIIDLKTLPGYAFSDQTVFLINGEAVDRTFLNGAHSCSLASRTYTMKAPELITAMDIQLHHIPAAGEVFNGNYDVVEASTMAQIEWWESAWIETGCPAVNPLTFAEGGQYHAELVIRGQTGYALTDDTVVTVDGEPAADWQHLGGGFYCVVTRDYTVHEERVIPAVEVYVNTPVGYSVPAPDPYVPDYESYEVSSFVWSDENGTELTMPFEFEPNKLYTITVQVVPKEDYMFSAEELSARIFWDEAEIVRVEPHLLTIRASAVSDPGHPNPFVDVEKGKFYYEPVMWAYYHDPQITAGTDDTHFSPNRDCTRAQVVTFLWRANGCPAPTITEHPFTDVKASAYYYTAMLWAVETGITTGTSPTTFGPNKACTRAQVVTFLWRAKGSPEPESTECPFTDVKASSAYYKAILWAVEQGVTNGTSATTFGPSKTCNRGQVVTFLFRVYGPKG